MTGLKHWFLSPSNSFQTLDLASLKEGSLFYFYNDIDTFTDEPHMFRVAYEDDMSVTDEIYRRLSFNNSGIRFVILHNCLFSSSNIQKNRNRIII